MFIFYKALYIVFLILFFPFLILFAAFHILLRPSYFKAYLQRFSIILPKTGQGREGNVWLHAVSVGEILSCAPFIKLMQNAGYNIYLSTTTPTGYLSAKKTYSRVCLFYFPFDYGFMVRRVLRRIKPFRVVLCEMEIWPSFILNVKKKHIPLYLISGRLGDKEFRGYKSFSVFFKGIISCFTGVFMQSDADTCRMKLLSKRDDVKTLGSLKFDVTSESKTYEIEKLLPSKEFILAASTHKGEEEIILGAYKELLKVRPDIKLVIAPRHVHRRKEIERLVLGHGFSCSFRSSDLVCREDVFIIDTVGELMGVYKHASLVIMGGSLVPGIGGP